MAAFALSACDGEAQQAQAQPAPPPPEALAAGDGFGGGDLRLMPRPFEEIGEAGQRAVDARRTDLQTIGLLARVGSVQPARKGSKARPIGKKCGRTCKTQ